MPMSASCLVNRDDLLGLLRDLESLLPETISQAQELLGDKQGVVEEGRREAEEIAGRRPGRAPPAARGDRRLRGGAHRGRPLLDEARTSAESMRVEVEDYVDAKLANFEIVLTKTLSAVERGRQKLSGRHELEALVRAAAGGRRASSRQPPTE